MLAIRDPESPGWEGKRDEEGDNPSKDARFVFAAQSVVRFICVP